MLETIEELADRRMREVGPKSYPIKDLQDPALKEDPRVFPHEIREELADGDVYARMHQVKHPEDEVKVQQLRFFLEMAYRVSQELKED